MTICRKQQTEPVDLDHCLRAFTTEEKLEETYHCSHCKGKQPATKKLQIWKLPPILIVHLKRFNFVNNKWVKSQKVVNFPFKDFDPTPYLASVPQETILRHKELIEHGNANASTLTNGFMGGSNSNLENDSSLSEITPEHSIMSYSIKEVDTIDTESTAADLNDVISEVATKPEEIQTPNGNRVEINTNNSQTNNNNKLNSQEVKVEQSPSSKIAHSSRRATMTNASIKMRKRLVSTSLTKSPVIDGAFVDYHQHNLNEGQDPFDLKYKLYAVVVSNNLLNYLAIHVWRF